MSYPEMLKTNFRTGKYYVKTFVKLQDFPFSFRLPNEWNSLNLFVSTTAKWCTHSATLFYQ